MPIDELRQAEAAVADCMRAGIKAELLAHQIASEQQECRRLRDQLADELADVEALEKMSVSSLLARVRGRLDDQLRVEREEVAEVEVELATRQQALARLTAEFQAVRDRSTALPAAEERLAAAVAARERELIGADDATARTLADLDTQLTTERAARAEIVEAHQAAIGADAALERAIEAMTSSRNWSSWDTFGGGDWLSSAVKHQRLDDSVELLAAAHAALITLRSELGDLADDVHHPNLSHGTGGGQRIRDIWFDNFLTDLNVHRKITRSLDELRRSHAGVRQLVQQLAREDRIATDRVARLESERDHLLRNA